MWVKNITDGPVAILSNDGTSTITIKPHEVVNLPPEYETHALILIEDGFLTTVSAYFSPPVITERFLIYPGEGGTVEENILKTTLPWVPGLSSIDRTVVLINGVMFFASVLHSVAPMRPNIFQDNGKISIEYPPEISPPYPTDIVVIYL